MNGSWWLFHSIGEGVLFLSFLNLGESKYSHSVLQLFSLASIQVVDAEGTCQNGARIIGSDNRMQYEAVDSLLRAGRLYLNTDNPAQSDGTITYWEYCYYPPNEPGIYQLFFTIFRPRTFNSVQLYVRQSPILNFSISVNGLGEEFLCSSFIPVEQISVQQGDIIGVCLPRTNSLNIVSNTSSAILSGDRLFFGESDCSNIPEFVLGRTFLRLAMALQENRIAHFYGQISTNTEDCTSITNSEPKPSMAISPPVSDQTPTYTTAIMLTPSRQLSIAPTVTVVSSEGELPTPPTSIVLPTTTDAVSNQPETDPTTSVHNTVTLTSSIAPLSTVSGGELPTSTALPVLVCTSGQILGNPGTISGLALGGAALIIIPLIISSVAILFAARWRSKLKSLNQSNTSDSEVDSRSEEMVPSMEVLYDYVRSVHFFQDADDVVTKKNLAYVSTRIEMSPNIAYTNKKAVLHAHNPLNESLLPSNEYAYI